MWWPKNKSEYPKFFKDRVYRVIIEYKYKPDCYSSGAGFFIGKNLFLTCAHVVFGNELASVRKDQEFISTKEENEHKKLETFYKFKKPVICIELNDGQRVATKLKDFDAAYDVALLEVDTDGKNINVCSLDYDSELTYGDDIAFGGFPDQFSYKFDKTPFAYHEGIISSFPETVIGGDKYQHLQINSINLKGNSGAPLFKLGGNKVIGIINGNMNWGRDDLLTMKNNEGADPIFDFVSHRIPLSIAYATTIRTLSKHTGIFDKFDN